MIKKIIFIIFLTIFLVGCSLFNSRPITTHKVEFKDNVVIDYKEKVNSTEYVVSIDNITVNANNIDGNKLYVSNFYVKCPDINTKKLGVQNITYEIGEEKYDLKITIEDKKSPVIELKQSTYEIDEGTTLTIDKVKYSVSDNYSSTENIKIELKIINSTNAKIIATDEMGNKAEKDIVIKVKEKKKEETNTSSSNNTNNSSSNNGNASSPNENKNTGSTVKSGKKYLFSDGETEGTCVSALSKSGKSGSCVPIKDDSGNVFIGFQLIFY